MRPSLLSIVVFSLAACAPRPPATPPAPSVSKEPPLHALGTEPFWSADLRDGHLTITRPDYPALSGAAKRVTPAGDRAAWEAKAAGGETIRMRIAPGDCSDGMSDRHYPLEAEIELDGEHLKGCASRG